MTTTPNPTAEQIERAAETFYEDPAGLTSWTRLNAAEPDIAERYRVAMGRALTAVGVAPQEPNQNETKSEKNLVSLDSEKVAAFLTLHVLGEPNGGTASRSWCDCSCGHREQIVGGTRDLALAGARRHRARALCEAYTEGKLT